MMVNQKAWLLKKVSEGKEEQENRICEEYKKDHIRWKKLFGKLL